MRALARLVFTSVIVLVISGYSFAQEAVIPAEDSLASIFKKFPTYLGNEYVDPANSPKELQDLIAKFLEGEISIDEIKGSGVWVTLSGGDIIGNGGGLIEAYFYSGLSSIKKYVDACLVSQNCQTSKEEKALLTQIARIAESNKKFKFSLIFVDKNLGQNLFVNTDFTRVAMTGHRPALPIFINKNKIYDEKGNPQLSRKEVISILIHELGHQAGVRNHSQLDRLGAKVSGFVSRDELSIQFQPKTGDEIEFWIEGSSGPIENLTAHVAFGEKVRNMTSALKSKIVCPSEFSLYDVSLSNLHWRRGVKGQERALPVVGMWADLQCIENSTGAIYDVFLDLEMGL